MTPYWILITMIWFETSLIGAVIISVIRAHRDIESLKKQLHALDWAVHGERFGDEESNEGSD